MLSIIGLHIITIGQVLIRTFQESVVERTCVRMDGARKLLDTHKSSTTGEVKGTIACKHT